MFTLHYKVLLFKMKMINIVSPLLKQREETISRFLTRECTNAEMAGLITASTAMFSLFGFLIGCSHSAAQAASSAIKLPLLFYFTSAICFPTLYFFLAFLGARQQFRQFLSFIILCNTYIANIRQFICIV
jgi:hypothetical protein